MSSHCSVCNNPCGSDESAQVIKCSGACDRSFHMQCIKDDIVGKKTRSYRDWKCMDCRNYSSIHSSASCTTDVITKDFIVRVLEDFKKEVFGELKTFKNEMSELSAAVQFVSGKLDESTKLMKEVKSEIVSVKREHEELRSKNANLTSEVHFLKDRVRSLEQYSRKNNVEISGLPVTPGEDVIDLVKDVGLSLGLEITKKDISAAHRVPSFQKSRMPALVVQFVNRSTKETVISKYREKKGGMTAHNVNAAFPVQKLYINEHLSPENKVFLNKLKSKAKELGYAFTWCRDGKFFVRRSQGEKYIRIDSYDNIDKLK